MIDSFVKGVLLFVAMGVILAIVFIVAGMSTAEMNILAKGGYLPRVIAWACMLLSVYGLARRRFSPLLMMLFYASAFFFTYLGQFIIKGVY